MDRILNATREFNLRHERLKNYVHTAFRYPLPRWGRWAMACIYFSIPVVGGWHVMQWAISKSHEEIGEGGEKLKIKEIQGFGDKAMVDGKLQKVGAGGIGGGVRLAVSDPETQQRNQKQLEAFFRKERKRRRKALKKKKEEEEARDAKGA